MGYFDKIILWIGKHPYLSIAGMLTIFIGGGMALGQLYKSKDSDAPVAIDKDTPAANASAAAAPQVTETPYSYDAHAGNPDPSIPFINGSRDKEWEDVVNWHMEQFKKFSIYDVDEFQKYIVFRPGKNSDNIIDFTKDKRRIVYINDFIWMSIESLKKQKNNNATEWNFYRTTAHFIGHDKFNKEDDGCDDSKCIEMPAIEYDTDAFIRAGRIQPEYREKAINQEWELWKKQHNYVEKQ